jgi:tRNA(adenine34) deaminase
LTKRDGRYLRQAIAWSRVARERATAPLAPWSWRPTDRCWPKPVQQQRKPATAPAHAEVNAIRAVSPHHDRESWPRHPVLVGRTLRDVRRRHLLEQHRAGGLRHRCRAPAGVPRRAPEQRDAELSCRDVFAASPHPIECIGPALLAEASAAHQGFWQR